MKIVLTGANGQLGTELRTILENGEDEFGPIDERLRGAVVIGTDVAGDGIETLDITDLDWTAAFLSLQKPDVVINCGAFTNVDGCERDTDTAFRVNALGPRNLALGCREAGARLIHISTDYVFSGKPNGGVPLDESVQPCPISAYGRTKLLGEEYVRQFCSRSFIVRTAWLYGVHGKNFVKTMVNAGKKLGRLEVVNDQLGNPTSAADLAHQLLKLAVSEQYGLYHGTCQGVCSWYDFACEIIRLSGVQAEVVPCTSAEYKSRHPESADRPAWSALENRMFRLSVGDDMRPWQQALQEFFRRWDGN